jgi:hypothetical protein
VVLNIKPPQSGEKLLSSPSFSSKGIGRRIFALERIAWHGEGRGRRLILECISPFATAVFRPFSDPFSTGTATVLLRSYYVDFRGQIVMLS